MHFHPSANLPSNHPLMVGSTPADTVNQAAAIAAANPPPSMSQPAYNLQHYITRVVQAFNTVEQDAWEYRKAVKDLKACGLWKAQFKTWGRTCRECIGISPQRGNELIRELTECYEEDNGETETPLSDTDKAHESDMRMALPPVANPDALLDNLLPKPTSTATTPTSPAPKTKATPAAAPEPPKDSTPRDLIGYPIPTVLMERWNQRQEVQDRITAASRLRCALEEIANKGHQNPIYGLYDWQGMIRTVGQLQFHLGQCKPEVVCYECDGNFLKLKSSKGGDGITRHCHLCSDRGFVTQRQWNDYAATKLAAIQDRVKARLERCK